MNQDIFLILFFRKGNTTTDVAGFENGSIDCAALPENNSLLSFVSNTLDNGYSALQ